MDANYDFDHFTTALRDSIVRELARRREELRAHEVDALTVDCHPWHGILDLAVRTTEDEGERWEIGDWQLYPWTNSEDKEDPWSATEPLRESMQAYWKNQVKESEDAAAEAAKRFYRACAAALTSPEVKAEVEQLRRTPDFELFVGDPDGFTRGNFCSEPL